jgi:hypothetical protein
LLTLGSYLKYAWQQVLLHLKDKAAKRYQHLATSEINAIPARLTL